MIVKIQSDNLYFYYLSSLSFCLKNVDFDEAATSFSIQNKSFGAKIEMRIISIAEFTFVRLPFVIL